MTPTPLDLAPIRARLEAATPGPWKATPVLYGAPGTSVQAELPCINGLSAWFQIAWLEMDEEGEQGYYTDGVLNEKTHEQNAAFIASARTDIPALLAEVERLRDAGWGAYELLINSNEHAFDNGVTDSTGTIDEGDVRAGRIITTLRQALGDPTP